VIPTCRCLCGASLDGMRADALYASEACRKRADRAASADKGRTEHPLGEARAAQEASELKDHYSQVIYQGIIDRLERGSVHADDLEDLFPECDRTICRKLVGAQFGSLASRRYIREKERRKSSIASRKGAKSSVWEFTRLGRERLAGVRTGVLTPQGPGGMKSGIPCSASADPGEDSSAALTGAAGEDCPASEPVPLFEEPAPPSAYDPYSEAA
jgi:hypothetical protein